MHYLIIKLKNGDEIRGKGWAHTNHHAVSIQEYGKPNLRKIPWDEISGVIDFNPDDSRDVEEMVRAFGPVSVEFGGK